MIISKRNDKGMVGLGKWKVRRGIQGVTTINSMDDQPLIPGQRSGRVKKGTVIEVFLM